MTTTDRPRPRGGRFATAWPGRWGGVLLIVAWAATGAGGEDKPKPEGGAKALVLFDGKGLDGWKTDVFGGSGKVAVEAGAIVMAEGRPMTGITSTRIDLPRTNYELSYEAQRLTGSDFFAAATFPVGKSHITFVNGGWGGHVSGLSSLDWMDASENETSRSIDFKNKTWYRFRVRVTDKVIRCWVDDKKVVDVGIEDRNVDTRIETNANHPLGFASWRCGGALRKVEVRPLTAAEVAETKKAGG
jgi:hypothetical protein